MLKITMVGKIDSRESCIVWIHGGLESDGAIERRATLRGTAERRRLNVED